LNQQAAKSRDLDRAATTVDCEGAGYSEVPRNLSPSATTLDLSDNELRNLGSLSRLRHIVNLRLRGNRISHIRHHPSHSPGQFYRGGSGKQFDGGGAFVSED